MSLITEIDARLKGTLKDPSRAREKDLLRYLKGAIQTKENSREQGGKPLTDKQVVSIIEQTIEGNKDLIEKAPGHENVSSWKQENEILGSLMPQKLTLEQINVVLEANKEAILSATSDNLAMKVAMPLFQGQMVDGAVVRQALVTLRAGSSQ